MKIYIDNREHDLIHYLEPKTTIQKVVLPLGDILLKTDDDKETILIERKTIQDLLASIKDGRYREQSHRLIGTSKIPLHRVIYLIEGVFNGQTASEKQTVYSSIVSLNQIKGFSVMRTWNLAETGEVILNMTTKLQKEMEKGNFSVEPISENTETPQSSSLVVLDLIPNSGVVQSTFENYCSLVKKVKKENITPENMGEIILCQIPGISSVNAVAIMKGFSSISQFLDKIKTEPLFLEQFTLEASNGKKKKLNKNIIENIRKYLLLENTM
jgi:ERCC4-type nuclease